MAKWLPKLDKKLEQYSEGSHEAYRVYMSAEPAADRAGHIIPQGVLESSIKITNEPPTGMLANLNKAFDNFNQVCMCQAGEHLAKYLISILFSPQHACFYGLLQCGFSLSVMHFARLLLCFL